jgi:ribosomal protection tetracycline resistance protein
VTAARVFASGEAVQRDEVRAGEIARLWGLEARIGDWIGERQSGTEHHFAPPTLEAVVRPVDPADANRLRVALEQLAEQDPLIDVRQDADAQLSVSLYGEVQKEVVQATLADDYGLDVEFSETSTICIERPVSSGEAVEILNTPTNPFHADLGLRIDRAAPGSGVDFRVDVDTRDVPLYLFKTHRSFAEHMEEYTRVGLREGLYGWQVTDCVVTMTKIGYSLADGPPSRRGPMPTAGDLRKLMLVVLMEALRDAGSQVCEPYLRIRLEVPTPTIGSVLSVLARLGAAVETPSPQGELTKIDAILPAARANDLQRQLPGLTGGEGVLETDFEGYSPVAGEPPTRRRTTPNPLNREEFLMHLARRV